jgi:hypothetical protein
VVPNKQKEYIFSTVHTKKRMMPKELELSGTAMSVDGMSLLRNGLNASIGGNPMDVFILSAATIRRTTPKVLGHDGTFP